VTADVVMPEFAAPPEAATPPAAPRDVATPPAAPPARTSWRAVLGAAIVATLVNPASWAFGLAGFLAGGGLLLVAWPIFVLPTPTGLQTLLGGPAITLVFGTVSTTLILLIAGGLTAAVAVVIAACWVGGWAERQGIVVALGAAADEGLLRGPAPGLAGAPGAGRITIVRLLSMVPVLAVLGLAWTPVYRAAYRQLTVPDELVTPLPIRVMLDVPGLVAAIVVVWLVSDAAGALGVRRLVLERRGVMASWLLGWADLVRSPLRVLGTQLAGLSVLVLAVAPAMLAVGTGWGRAREALVDGRAPIMIVAIVATWVAMWLGGLVLAGVAAAFRNAAFTFLAMVRRHPGGGPPA
jgi:hypothetical protein